MTIRNLPEVKQASFGYFQDVKNKQNNDTLRVFSQSNNISSYELTKGKFPANKSEIALTYLLNKKYHIGQKITFAKPDILKNKTYKIVGFFNQVNFWIKTRLGKPTLATAV